MHTIMIAEDDPIMTDLLKTLLEIEDFKVITFVGDSQEKLIDMLSQDRPDILLLDVNLHRINGVDALRTIRQTSMLSELHVILTSGLDLQDQYRPMGANAFIMKPYNPDDLIKVINVQFST